MNLDERYMARAIELARLGTGKTAPNPLVGAVIVHNNKIIGEGYHAVYGGPHAEVNAVNSVKDSALLPESTIYVTLEPCSHFGKTPPCSDLICSKQFKRVVVGMKDPHLKVAGKGIAKIDNAGIETTVGVLEQACRDLNKGFLSFHEKGRPYILLKWARTKDGFIDDHGSPIRISGPESDQLVQELRNEYQAILVGKQTVINDNPRLTCRLEHGNNPIRIVLDSNAELSTNYHVFNSEAQTIVINTVRNESKGNITYLQISDMTITEILKGLASQNIISVLVEGGNKVHHSFISSGIWDEAIIIEGDIISSGGTQAPDLKKMPEASELLGVDTIKRYYNK